MGDVDAANAAVNAVAVCVLALSILMLLIVLKCSVAVGARAVYADATFVVDVCLC